jgi:hypothetical protein
MDFTLASDDPRIESAMATALAGLRTVVDRISPGTATFEEREAATLKVANELARRSLEEDLRRLAVAHEQDVIVGGRRYRRHQPGVGNYHSLCGTLEVPRWTYRDARVRNGPTIVPLELLAGMIHNATPALAFSVAQAYAKAPLRSYEEDMQAAHRSVPSRSTLERLGGFVGGGAKQEALTIETCLRQEEKLPEGAHAISVGLDRTAVPMAEERPPGQPPSSRRKPRRKPRVRKAPHPIDVCYRMAYVGTVSVVDENGETLTKRQYAATAEEGPDDLVYRMMADVESLRRQARLDVVVVQDGAPELWRLTQNGLRSIGVHKWTEVLDRYHVMERMAAALEIIHPKHEARRRAMFAKWVAYLDKSDAAVRHFARWLEPYAYASAAMTAKLGPHVTYFSTNAFHARYVSARRAGFPVASGVTEGACKSLVSMRAKRSGQRWYHDGLTAVLTLRAIHASDRLSRFWALYAPRYRQPIRLVA